MIELRRRTNTSNSLLPTEYQQVEYVRATNTNDYQAYLVLDYYPSSLTDEIILDTIIPATGPSQQGIRQYPIGYDFRIGNGSVNARVMCGFGKNTWYDNDNRYAFLLGQRASIRMNKNGAYANYNGIEYTMIQWNTVGVTSEIPFHLFTEYDTYIKGIRKQCEWYVYHFKVIRDGIDLMELIPCYRKDNKEIGMYDIVNRRFLTNDGTGKFYAGPDIIG